MIDRTRFMVRPNWENPRIHLLDDVWLLTIVAIVIATGVPWFANDFGVDLGTASAGLLALGAMHVVFTQLASSGAPHGRWQERTLTILQLTGVLLLGFIWRHVGALQNPLFLLVFTLPVIGGIFLSRWHPYLIALVAICVVTIVAMSQAPELRWYAGGVLGDATWLTAWLGHPNASTPPSFTGFYAPSTYLLVLLEVFSVLLLACAAAAEYVGLIAERLDTYALVARGEAQRGQELWSSLIEQLPLPALLIDPSSLTVVAASARTADLLGCDSESLAGRPVFETLRLSYPDAVQQLLKGADGTVPPTVVRIGEQMRLAQLQVLHIAHKGRRLALLTIEDVTESFCVKAALDTSEYAALVVDAGGRVMIFNERAAGLFGMTRAGVAAGDLLASEPGLPWWEPGLTGRRKLHVTIGPRIYQVTSSAVRLPGEAELLFAVSILPVAEGPTNDASITGATTLINARQLR